MFIKERIINPINELAENGKLTGIILICTTIFSLSLSNSEFNIAYLKLWETEIGFSFLHKSILHWINDGLMAVFFLLVGLEIKRELISGELSTRKQAILPAAAALGGIMVPAAIYVLLNLNKPENLVGWAIPTATDIAFSLGILSLLGQRVPFALKVFLMALAIIDDLGAILIIATFYTQGVDFQMLILGIGVFVLLLILNYLNVKISYFYLIPGFFLWYFILKGGIHPTIAGVLLALSIPAESGEKLEHSLQKPVSYLILPLFALANTAMPLSMGHLAELFSTLSLGIILGLVIGKPFGIILTSWIVVKLKWADLPEGINWKQIAGLGSVAGIGFTMSIFISALSFTEGNTLMISKLAILAGSIISAIVGMMVLTKFMKKS